MRFNTRKKIMLGIGAPIMLFFVLVGTIYNSLQYILKTDDMVRHTHEVLDQSQQMMLHMVDMETGMRGFLLTGKEEFLEPYERGRAHVHQSIAQLVIKTSDNPKQEPVLNQILALLTTWENAVAQPNIAFRRQVGANASMVEIATRVDEAKGKYYFDQMRDWMQIFEDEERRLMILRVDTNDMAVQETYAAIYIVFSLILLLGGLLVWLISKNIADPLIVAKSVMSRFIAGDHQARIPQMKRHDEISAMAVTFNELADKLSENEQRLIQQAAERQGAEEKAVAASKAKSAFLSTMSHEIRTPLNGVLGVAQILKKSQLDTEQNKHVDTILSSGSLLLSVLNNVLDMSKIEAGNIVVEQLSFECRDLILSLSSPYKHLSHERALDFAVSIELGSTNILQGDPNKLQQILNNLLGNAFKFTHQGTISLSVQTLDPADHEYIHDADVTLKITVADTGKGIGEQRLPYIFDAFSQEDDTITRRFGGTGLGLSIVKQYCEHMGGSIHVVSEEGNGTTFSVILPYQQATEAQLLDQLAQERPVVTQPLPELCILLVEDNPINAMIAKNILQSHGHQVIHAEDGQQAVEQVQRCSGIDMILMDIHMPVMDGMQATQAIKAMPDYAGIPIIALTAESFDDRVSKFLAVGMEDILTKPYTEEQMLQIIAKVARSRASTA